IKANLTALLQQLRKKYLTKDSTVSGSNSNIRNVIEYINENLYSDMSLDGICKRFFVNKSRLNRDFKEYTGSTVWDYIIIKRLLKAQEMIRSGVKTNIAAESVGFHDYSNFYRSYKSHFKVSPKDDGKN
ncbi:MAG: helix-turn-helix transcriptional regulator, partial [Clostridia bacterium]|nr:helix-turn-helix transcriptional regulator [Clostridia bacterium]